MHICIKMKKDSEDDTEDFIHCFCLSVYGNFLFDTKNA